jgi:hypothetical protein
LLKNVAIAYATEGYKVFPCGRDKKPLTKKGYLDASDNPIQIAEWWTKHPNALIGMPCGENDLVVLDFDSYKHAGIQERVERIVGIDFTDHPHQVRTQSGGLHVYFKGTEINSRAGVDGLDGFDVRGKGGYIIVPDGISYLLSNTPNGSDPKRLQKVPDLPKQLAEFLAPKRPTATRIDQARTEVDREKVGDALRHIPNDNRPNWLSVGMGLHHAFSGSEAGFEIWCEWSKSWPEYNHRDQVTNWESFETNRSEPVTIGTIYMLAADHGWTGLKTDFSANTAVPLAKPTQSGELAKRTAEKMFAAFDERGHKPSPEQRDALMDNLNTLEGMANRSLESLLYLSPLDPGVGKTQGLVFFTRELVASAPHSDVGMLVCLSRLQEIPKLIEDMALGEDEYAVMVGDAPKNKVLNTMGNGDRDKAQILFTTQQKLESLAHGGRKFRDLQEYYHLGKPRDVRVWDESILPGKGVTVNVTIIEALTHVTRRYPKLHACIDDLIGRVKKAQDGSVLEIPEFEEVTGVGREAAEEIFRGEKSRVRHGVRELWAMAGKAAAIKRDRGASGNTVLSYVNTLPDDLGPALVLDASARVRKTYPNWHMGRGGIVTLRKAAKDYGNLTIHVWKRGGGKWAWEDDGDTLVEGIVNTVMTKPTEPWLIVHHKAEDYYDVVKTLERNLAKDVFSRISFVSWGDHSATNEYRDIENVILAGTLFMEPSYYEALGRLSRGMASTETLSAKQAKEIEEGEHAHLILQAGNRGSVRKSMGPGCYPCNLYIIAAQQSGIPNMLEDVFPGCKIRPWTPVERELKGKRKDADRFIAADKRDTIPTADVARGIGMDRDKFNEDVLSDPDFLARLARSGINLERKKGRGGSYLVREKVFNLDTLVPW